MNDEQNVQQDENLPSQPTEENTNTVDPSVPDSSTGVDMSPQSTGDAPVEGQKEAKDPSPAPEASDVAAPENPNNDTAEEDEKEWVGKHKV